jgi:hypothetical protein
MMSDATTCLDGGGLQVALEARLLFSSRIDREEPDYVGRSFCRLNPRLLPFSTVSALRAPLYNSEMLSIQKT